MKRASEYSTEKELFVLKKRVLRGILGIAAGMGVVYCFVVYAIEEGLAEFVGNRRNEVDAEWNFETDGRKESGGIGPIREDFIAVLFLMVTCVFVVCGCLFTILAFCAVNLVSSCQTSLKVVNLMEEITSKKLDIEFSKQLNRDVDEDNTLDISKEDDKDL